MESRGWADREWRIPNDASTRFNIASITKLLTAVAMCRLAEVDRVDLNQPVAEVLPGSTIAEAGEMSLVHLLTHAAGFPQDDPDEDEGGGWRATPRVPLTYRPGRGWCYSNVGYAVLGLVIEGLTGLPYDRAIAELVLGPVGMTDTAFDEPTNPALPRAVGYAPVAGSREGAVERAPSPGRGTPYGYAWSTVDDLERLVDAIVAGRIVGERSAARILHGDRPTDEPGRWAGFGMFSERVGGLRVSTLSGAGPGISAWLDLVPERAHLAIVLSNLPKPAAHEVGQRLRALYLGA